MHRQIAYARVILPSGKILHREIVVFNKNDEIINHFPLKEELPFVEWRNETFNINSHTIVDNKKRM